MELRSSKGVSKYKLVVAAQQGGAGVHGRSESAAHLRRQGCHDTHEANDKEEEKGHKVAKVVQVVTPKQEQHLEDPRRDATEHAADSEYGERKHGSNAPCNVPQVCVVGKCAAGEAQNIVKPYASLQGDVVR